MEHRDRCHAEPGRTEIRENVKGPGPRPNTSSDIRDDTCKASPGRLRQIDGDRLRYGRSQRPKAGPSAKTGIAEFDGMFASITKGRKLIAQSGVGAG